MNVSKKCNRNLFLKCGLKRCREISFGRFYFSTLFAFQHREAQQLCGTGLLFFSLNILYKGRFLSVSVLAIFTIPVNFGFLCQATEQLSSFSQLFKQRQESQQVHKPALQRHQTCFSLSHFFTILSFHFYKCHHSFISLSLVSPFFHFTFTCVTILSFHFH